MSRTKARVVAMQALFLLDADEGGMEEIMEMRAQEEGITDDDMMYLREAVAKVQENLDEIDTHIKNYSIDWSFGRLGKVDRAILRLALAEILFVDSVPSNVAISEAVRIAKKYGTEHSSRFINGILGKFVREHFKNNNNSHRFNKVQS